MDTELRFQERDCVRYDKDRVIGYGTVISVTDTELCAGFWMGFLYIVRDDPAFFTKITPKERRKAKTR
jgi:hypothetical protein